MLSKLTAQVGLMVYTLLPASIGTATPVIQPNISLPEVVITAKKQRVHLKKEFLGFKLLGQCDTRIDDQLKGALSAYTGPNVQITSLRRHWNSSSQHTYGKAVDMEWSGELIDYLVSEEGKLWLDQYNLMFYIEGKPGSFELRKYKVDSRYSQYVFENKRATGNHVHIGIKK